EDRQGCVEKVLRQARGGQRTVGQRAGGDRQGIETRRGDRARRPHAAQRQEERERRLAMIRLEQITKTYDAGENAVQALRGVDVSIEDGEFIAVIGPSGSGKSTLMHILGCLDTPTTGKYWLDEQDVAELTARTP